jgi:hypothetical protein
MNKNMGNQDSLESYPDNGEVNEDKPRKGAKDSLGVLLDPVTDEMALECPNQEAISLLSLLVRLHMQVIATNYLLHGNVVTLWIRDRGARVKNALAAGLLGEHTRLAQRSKGTRVLYHPQGSLTSYQFLTWIQSLPLVVLSHSPLHQSSPQCVFF